MEFSKIETQPVAAATAIIQGTTYRISVLTERLLRLEYNETGHFEDRASQVVWNRAFPKVEFEVNETEEELDLETSFLHLRSRSRVTGKIRRAAGFSGKIRNIPAICSEPPGRWIW